jgi:monoamine oxidase
MSAALRVSAALWSLGLAALAGCGGGGGSSGPPGAGRVVVVGAGLAGLTAAADLRDAGWDVVVFEARDRVGGRVYTLRSPFTNGLHAEGGGESIDDNHTAIQALVEKYGLSLEHRPPNKELNGVTYYQGVRTMTSAFVLGDSATSTAYLGYFSALQALAAGIDPAHPEAYVDAQKLDSQSLADFMAAQKLPPKAAFLVGLSNRGEYNSDPSSVSLLFAAQQAAAAANVPDSAVETMRISGGNSGLPDAIAASLGSIVQLNTVVTAVEEQSDHVHVTASTQEIDAAFAVVALPAPPLRKIAFTPPLTGDLGAAVQGLNLGQAAKVVTQYKTRFWESEGLSGFTSTDLPFGIGWSPTDSYASVEGLLSQFITGTPAKDAAALDDATRISQFQQQLDQAYPEGASQHAGPAATMAWANEPFTGGGYAVYAPGQFARFWPAFRKGTTRLRFAGEHTEVLLGYMESAVRSGHRVAGEIGAPSH